MKQASLLLPSSQNCPSECFSLGLSTGTAGLRVLLADVLRRHPLPRRTVHDAGKTGLCARPYFCLLYCMGTIFRILAARLNLQILKRGDGIRKRNLSVGHQSLNGRLKEREVCLDRRHLCVDFQAPTHKERATRDWAKILNWTIG